jgi:hypothetical protein
MGRGLLDPTKKAAQSRLKCDSDELPFIQRTKRKLAVELGSEVVAPMDTADTPLSSHQASNQGELQKSPRLTRHHTSPRDKTAWVSNNQFSKYPYYNICYYN